MIEKRGFLCNKKKTFVISNGTKFLTNTVQNLIVFSVIVKGIYTELT